MVHILMKIISNVSKSVTISLGLAVCPNVYGRTGKCIFGKFMATGKQSVAQLGEGLALSQFLSIVTAL